MQSSLEEMIEFAIKHQRMVLEIELEKGVPLNYLDDEGHYILEYPDGHKEYYDWEEIKAAKCQN